MDSRPPPYVSALNTDHVFPVVDSKNKPWASITVKSRAASSNHTPTFLTSDTIRGSVTLDLKKEKKIKKIEVSLVGWIAVSGYSEKHVFAFGGGLQETGLKFLIIKELIWPERESTTTNILSTVWPTSSTKLKEKKFNGHHEWSFETTLPPIIIVKEDAIGNTAKAERVYDLPPSFTDKGVTVLLAYDLSVEILGAGIFESDAKLTKSLRIVPTRFPPPPSMGCIAALQKGRMPPTQHKDPEGWELSSGALFTGVRDETNDLFINCKMVFPKPLVYTRGRSLLFRLILDSPEPLDDIIDPPKLQICLVRNLTILQSNSTLSRESFRTDPNNLIMCSQMASVWKDDSLSNIGEGEGSGASKREFWGEFVLNADLATSFEFFKPCVQYYVVLLPFIIPGVTSKSKDPLLIQRVEIVAQSDPDFSPKRSYAPMGCSSPPPKAVVDGWMDYENVIGLQSLSAS